MLDAVTLTMEGSCPMLVLTRRSTERVMIGDDVVVTVLEIRGDQVRLGIEAPRDVQVHREEVLEAIEAGEEPRK